MPKIALVDDDRNILTSVAMTLEAEGFEVETYNDGQTALDAFNKKLPDMAVLDIKMPRMDGMDLLQRLRQRTSMPVIFLTSKDDEIDEVLGLRMGADDYVPKPFSTRELLLRIRTISHSGCALGWGRRGGLRARRCNRLLLLVHAASLRTHLATERGRRRNGFFKMPRVKSGAAMKAMTSA